MNASIIDKIKQYFTSRPIDKAWIFGSMSRGEETADSDVDILVEFTPDSQIGLFEHAAMIMDLEEILMRAVDIVTEKSLLPWVRPAVEKDKILIYERKTA